MTAEHRVGLVGCVKSKRTSPAPARDLYVSALFRGQRAFVEKSCDEWFVLSAEHGLVDPDSVLAPYEKTLKDASTRERRDWSNRVLASIDSRFPDLHPIVFEMHAGVAYLGFGLVEGILARGGQVENPVEGLSLGRRLSFYKKAGCL